MGAVEGSGLPPAPSLGRGAATISIATAISRLTGFLRVVAVAYAMGATFLANTYNSANTAPNLVFELVAAGVLTSVFVPTFVEYLARGEREAGWDAANALTSVALAGLTALAALVALGAPLIMRLFLIGVDGPQRAASIALGTDFLRLFAPQVIFYGACMIMTSALHASRRFGAPAIAPIFNNVVVIAVYLGYAALRGDEPPRIGEIGAAETWLLGAGTTMGVVAMTMSLLPSLRRLGWRFRFRWEPRHPAVKRAARLGAWALGYAGGYQAGLIVVLILANRVEGGVAAYQWAYTFFFLPHALFGAPIFHVLFTAMAEHVAGGDESGVVRRLRDGLGMLAFILFPISAAYVVLAGPLTRATLQYGVMTIDGADLVARVLVAFALGLPAYSAFLVFTRAYYALSDTKTPALVNAATVLVATASGAALFFAFDREWSVPGLALGHTIGFVVGALVLGGMLGRRLGGLGSGSLTAAVTRALLVAAAAGLAMFGVVRVVDASTRGGEVFALLASGAAGAAVYVLAMGALGAPELSDLARLLKSLVGRRR